MNDERTERLEDEHDGIGCPACGRMLYSAGCVCEREDEQKQEIKKFMTDYSNVNSDPSELAERAHDLGITDADFQAHRGEGRGSG